MKRRRDKSFPRSVTSQKRVEQKYGLTNDAYEALLEGQNFRCKICNRHVQDLKENLAVDHCHQTGIVRGLLCGHCNSVLAFARDSIRVLSMAIIYLEDNGYDL